MERLEDLTINISNGFFLSLFIGIHYSIFCTILHLGNVIILKTYHISTDPKIIQRLY